MGSTCIIRVFFWALRHNFPATSSALMENFHPLSKPPQQPWKHPLPPQPVIDKADPVFPKSGMVSFPENQKRSNLLSPFWPHKSMTPPNNPLWFPFSPSSGNVKGQFGEHDPERDSFRSLFLGPRVGQKESKNHVQNPQAPL